MVYKNDDLTDKKDWILANKNNGNGVKRAPPISDWKLKERYRPQLFVNENKIETVIQQPFLADKLMIFTQKS